MKKAATLSLAGSWRFALDPKNIGESDHWFENRLAKTTPLPGSLNATPHAGRNPEAVLYRLSSERTYVGAAWYQRDIVIPQTWAGQTIFLELERCHWETTVWLDDRYIGRHNSLSVPHRFELCRNAQPGRCTLTLRVDNTVKLAISRLGHSLTDHTQTNWNGVVGSLRLFAAPPVRIQQVQIYPEVKRRYIEVELALQSSLPSLASGTIEVRIELPGGQPLLSKVLSISIPGTYSQQRIRIPVKELLPLWDTDSPQLCEAVVILMAKVGERIIHDKKTATFGYRDWDKDATHFRLNGRRVFLRGTLECAIFPKTGYPPTTLAPWRRIMKIARSHGLNHLRFHSWCPPRAAFEAADAAGMLLQVELPCWIWNATKENPDHPAYDAGLAPFGNDGPRDAFLRDELFRILNEYGNHPSFVLMSMGNEPTGDLRIPAEFCRLARSRDSRRFYCPGAFNLEQGSPLPDGGDYAITCQVYSGMVRSQQQINHVEPSTDFDWRKPLRGLGRPVISHEIGQYSVSPRLAERKKYTGLLQPRNLDLIAEAMTQAGVVDQSERFAEASGRWVAQLYKDEIEAALRTPNQAGFQLLGLQDFPGQGTALVGLLDAFWDSKGVITDAEHRRHCSDTVPLARFPQRVWSGTEPFRAEIEVAHYGRETLRKCRIQWRLESGSGFLRKGEWTGIQLPQGKVSRIGNLAINLKKAPAPAPFTLTVIIPELGAENVWKFWHYPQASSLPEPDNVRVLTRWNAEAEKFVKAGGRALHLPDMTQEKGAVPVSFATAFWSPLWFKDQAGTFGILCDPQHPALREFPTEFHSNWQWYELTANSFAFNLKNAPTGARPVIQVIDGWQRNLPLALVYEFSVGQGHVVACAADLQTHLEHRPVARQLHHSLIRYLAEMTN